jgi:DNA repair protein RadC
MIFKIGEAMKTLREMPAHERPREKLLQRGAQTLSDESLLAIILGKGTRQHDVLWLARKVAKTVDEHGLDLTVDDLTGIEGIGTAKATLIVAAFEFVRRRIKPKGLKISRPCDAIPLVQHYGDRTQEHFLCISLNGANEVIQVRVVTIGLVNQSHVHPREVFSDAIVQRASAIIIAHNHPSGRVEPSREDAEVTQRIKVAGDLLGIELLDHVVFTQDKYYSFAEHDLL